MKRVIGTHEDTDNNEDYKYELRPILPGETSELYSLSAEIRRCPEKLLSNECVVAGADEKWNLFRTDAPCNLHRPDLLACFGKNERFGSKASEEKSAADIFTVNKPHVA